MRTLLKSATEEAAVLVACAFALALAAFSIQPASAATFYSESCSGGSTSLTCTFTANSGFLFIDSSAADLNLSGTISSATETFSGGSGAVTSSTVNITGSKNVDGFGTFNVTDDLTSGAGGNPTVSTITLTINGTTLALLANSDGNDVAAHICEISTGSACSSTFFALPNGTMSTPLPAAVWMFGSALAGCAFLMKRKQRNLPTPGSAFA
jgi:hypothetical protein